MKAFLIVAAVSIFGFFAHAEEIQVFKTLDGNTAFCDGTPRDVERTTQKVAMLEMAQYKITETQADATLRVNLVKCDNSKWILDSTPNTERYTALNGEQVTITYDNFQLYVVDKNFKVILHTRLDHLNGTANLSSLTTSGDTVLVSLPRNQRSPAAAYEVFIHATKHFSASGGYSYSENMSFGGFRIRLLN